MNSFFPSCVALNSITRAKKRRLPFRRRLFFTTRFILYFTKPLYRSETCGHSFNSCVLYLIPIRYTSAHISYKTRNTAAPKKYFEPANRAADSPHINLHRFSYNSYTAVSSTLPSPYLISDANVSRLNTNSPPSPPPTKNYAQPGSGFHCACNFN